MVGKAVGNAFVGITVGVEDVGATVGAIVGISTSTPIAKISEPPVLETELTEEVA